MIAHADFTRDDLREKIASGEIMIAGNKKLKIYGLLSCRSGKRMKKENRVFFKSEVEAKRNGYRPCGHCMREAYGYWLKSLRAKL